MALLRVGSHFGNRLVVLHLNQLLANFAVFVRKQGAGSVEDPRGSVRRETADFIPLYSSGF